MYEKNKVGSTYTDGLNIVEIIIILAVVCLYVFITWHGSSGVRGTDDYWYVADVQSLISGQGIHTNNVFPISVINGIPKIPRPFVHNTLNVYLAAIPAMLFGAYKGWIVTNIFSSLLTSYIIYIIVKRITGHHSALIAALTYLIMPLTLLQSIKPMAEASIAPIVALLVLVYMNNSKKYWKWLLLMTLAGLLLFCRPSFLPILLLVPFLYLYDRKKFDVYTICAMFGLIVLGIIFIKLNGFLFEPNVSYSNLQILNSAVPNKSNNMNIFFDLHPEKITITSAISNLKAKAIEGLNIQFIPKGELSFISYYLPYNLLFITSILMIYKYKNKQYLKLSLVALFFYMLHILTIILFQNQDRYMLVSLPVMIAAAAVFLGSLKWFEVSKKYVAPIILLVILSVFIPSNIAKAKEYSAEIVYYEKIYNDFGEVFQKKIPTTDNVIVEAVDPWQYIMQGYLLKPRETLFVLDTYNKDEYNILIKNINAKWIICRKDSPVIGKIKNRIGAISYSLPSPFDNYILYSLN